MTTESELALSTGAADEAPPSAPKVLPPSRRVASFGKPTLLRLNGLDKNAFRVWDGRVPFDCYLSQNKRSKTLFVMLHGAIARDRHVPPIFARWNWEPRVKGHILAISDPTLSFSEEVFIGWYRGSCDRDPIPGLVEIAETVAAQLGAEPIYYGSSAGGFAAIAAACHGGGKAIAINPQTDIVRYRSGTRSLAKLFSGTPAASRNAYPERWLAIEMLKKARAEGRDPRIVIGQNTLDEEHLTQHFTPFCEAFGVPPGGSEGQISTLLYEQEGGHNVKETLAITKQLVAMI